MTKASKPGRVFRGGVPTASDVRTLRERFGVPAEGTVIEYEEVAEYIRASVRSYRWKTVTWRWRKELLRDFNVCVATREGAFVVLTPDERISFGKMKIRTGMRGMRRGGGLIEATDLARCSEEMRREGTQLARLNASIQLAAETAARRFKVTLPE